MRKAAIILICIGIGVIIAANLYIDEPAETIVAPTRDNTTIRYTSAGEVVGFRDRHGARAWQGISYAAPPTNINRWRAPAPPVPHSGIVEAMAPGQPCPQYASLLSGSDAGVDDNAIAGAEDCLYLNIWSPPNAADLPVMVWIHGGSNSAGHGGSYSGARLAATRDVVVVTLNYRLGIFGWFTHPALQTGDRLDDSGNYGTLDLIRALQWIQENIAQFGGNPGNVTLFGESAGGFNTLTMMASPLAEGLFHRAIVQSGGYEILSLQTARAYIEQGGHSASSAELLNRLLIEDGLAEDRAAAKKYQAEMSAPRIREYLYGKTTVDLYKLLDNAGGYGTVNVPTLFRDGHVLPDLSDRELFSNLNNHNPVPVILGTNRDEAALYLVNDPAHVETWLGFLPRVKDMDTYRRLVKYRSLSWKERGVDSLAGYMSSAGNPAVFAYRFDWDEQPSRGGFDLSTALGAAHGLEIPFVFDDFSSVFVDYIYPGNAAQMGLADSMSSYWTEFAHTGNPGTGRNGRQPGWLAWGEDNHYSLLLDTIDDQGIRMGREMVSLDGIKAELAADTGFATARDHCTAYAQSFAGEDFDAAEFNALNASCADYTAAELRGW